MKWIDLPPAWLCLCLLLAWAGPVRVSIGALHHLGWLLVALGVFLTLAALMAFQKARTTIIPRQAPTALITHGIFTRTRNPIYLADVLFLSGLSLVWGSVLGLILVPVFAVFLDRRFIQGEEAVLREAFGSDFKTYAENVRRWL